MVDQKVLKEFFEEQFGNSWLIHASQIFLYKDKQLLKEGKYRQFAEEQIKKTRYIIWSVGFSIFLFLWYGIMFLIEYGSEPNWYDLSFGIVCMLGLVIVPVLASKEYYTIKSSMTLLLKLIDKSGDQIL